VSIRERIGTAVQLTAGVVAATLAPMTPPPPDEALMIAYGLGDAAAFETLYRRHRDALMRFLQRGLGSRAVAEECFQETWSRVIQARQRYQPDAKFSTWLYQIAHNLMIDQYRRARPEVSTDEHPGLLESPAGNGGAEIDEPQRVLSEFEQRRRLQLALAELPDDQRIAIELRLQQELSLEEIGQITGVGRETVKSRLRYAVNRLKERLAP
jgi:RNA polymerase sigma-70 factor (ECF subfamily)